MAGEIITCLNEQMFYILNVFTDSFTSISLRWYLWTTNPSWVLPLVTNQPTLNMTVANHSARRQLKNTLTHKR